MIEIEVRVTCPDNHSEYMALRGIPAQDIVDEKVWPSDCRCGKPRRFFLLDHRPDDEEFAKVTAYFAVPVSPSVDPEEEP